MSVQPGTDRVRRFLLEEHPIRGQLVQLESSWAALREHAIYPAPVRDLLGEATAAAVLLASTLKFDGSLTLQMQGDGAVRLLVAQCTHDFRIRSVAHFDAGRVAPAFAQLAGSGRIAVTVESIGRGAPYQGIVPLVGASLAECIDGYFATSEQLPTHVRLAADATRAGGLLVQRLPGAEESAAWERLREHAAGLDAHGLLYAAPATLVQRSASIDDVRLFAGSTVSFECRCSRDRVLGVLRSLGEDEVQDVLREQGKVTVTCDFCHRPYVFDAIDVAQAFGPPGVPAPRGIN
ncbi:MAG TPA: Hsp33 family molecular chaperone HslO [Steroidobacteraceae bacterium]|nr:Hsp33 family molecular chaperone HslO [Steroidobacteraceae bacterium]HQW08263.1 Hsp33 family molecular chaperone HslO [Steroidobacteraceae bacterium]HQX47546.1 Hsp33 family molecular chaperone HslO [Steroidobacteraceae bacterium]HQX78020.1 Hsp33 family molecular chaperone HslO [Steroidobacteraceae bacterium]HQZ79421.1 Hsp33 family molecular chaperone HslO [Steroidobacteraceae bacterium]